MQKLVCFGEVLIDFLAQAPATPGAPRAFLQYAGGAPANVAVAVARLGAHAEFAGMVGADMFGDFLVDELQRAGVGTAHVQRTTEAKTALAFVQLDDQGERSFSFYRPPAADLLFRAEHFDGECFVDAAAFHVCSNSLTETGIAATTLHGMDEARRHGALVSLDLNLRPMLWSAGDNPRPRLWQALQRADLVKLARNELEFLAEGFADHADPERAVLNQLFAGHAQLVMITDGAATLHWHSREHNGQARSGQVQSFSVATRDTTAAGDAFVGGVLFRLAERGVRAGSFASFVADAEAISDVLRFGAAVGALAVTRHGAFAAMPSHAEVLQLLKEAA